MKKQIFALAAVAAFISGSAFAADLGPQTFTKAPVAAVAAYNWTGFYLGGDIGGVKEHGSGTSNFTQPGGANPQTQSPSRSAFLGGIHAGYNWQFAPSWVLGVEGDWQWTRARSSFCRQTDLNFLPPCTDIDRGFGTIDSETRSIGTLRGRFGWATNSLLLYGTAGVAFADVNDTLSLDCRVAGCGASVVALATSGSASAFNTGWVAGAGAEWMLARNWMVRAEYLHIDAGQRSTTLNVAACPCALSWSHNLHYEIVRAGISYKFGSL